VRYRFTWVQGGRNRKEVKIGLDSRMAVDYLMELYRAGATQVAIEQLSDRSSENGRKNKS